MLYYNRGLKQLSRVLRKNMTESERLLWAQIRRKQLKGKQFYRQKIIGDYIVDFFCPSARLIVQVDGSQHFADAGPEICFKRSSLKYRWCGSRNHGVALNLPVWLHSCVDAKKPHPFPKGGRKGDSDPREPGFRMCSS